MQNSTTTHFCSALRQGWWSRRIKTRSDIDFRLSPAQKDSLRAIAWEDNSVAALAQQLGGMPSKLLYVLAVWGPVAVGIALYLVSAVGLSVWLNAPRWLTLVIALICTVVFMLPPMLRFVYLSWTWADAHVINSLLQVMEAAEQVRLNPSQLSFRPQLTRRIINAAKVFRRSYPRPGGPLPRDARTDMKRLASEGASALSAYAGYAPLGDAADMGLLRDDFGRAVLRVSSGNWFQVARLQPSGPPADRRPKAWRRVPKEVVIALISVTGTMTVSLLATLGKS